MNEQIITLKTAKLLKLKGFDFECVHFYNKGSNFKLQNDVMVRTGDNDIYEAPTQALVQKWLRDVHNININISFKPNIKKWDFFPYKMSLNGREYLKAINYYTTVHVSRRYDTYEDALENGIIEALDMIPSVIRANTPKDFNLNIHKVTKFKRDNYQQPYTLDGDGYYTYKGISAEASVHYTESALLACDDFTVIEFVER